MGLADEFQKLSYRLTNEQDEADWVRSNGQLLNVPTETIQLLNRYDKHISETVVNNTHNKQLVMNVKQYPSVNRNTQQSQISNLCFGGHALFWTGQHADVMQVLGNVANLWRDRKIHESRGNILVGRVGKMRFWVRRVAHKALHVLIVPAQQ